MIKLMLAAGLLLPFMLCAQLVAKSLTSSSGKFIGFYQYTPGDYNTNPSTKYPVIIFLHGIGERGNGTTELWKVRREGIPKYIFNGHPMKFTWNGKTETFLVLAPQCPDTTKWYFDYENYHVQEMIKYAKTNLRIDTNRIIVTGLSMGGGGTWKFASSSSENAKAVAAIATCAAACVEIKGSAIPAANLPVWAFHAIDDTSGNARPQCTFDAIDSINKFHPAVKPVLTVYSNGNHWVWDRAFDTSYKYHNPNIYEWFLAQNKSFAPNKLPFANAGSDRVISKTKATATLSASSSYDSDGSILKYFWRKLSGPSAGNLENANSAKASATLLNTVGTYVYELKVIDDRAALATDTVKIIVSENNTSINNPPVDRTGITALPDNSSAGKKIKENLIVYPSVTSGSVNLTYYSFLGNRATINIYNMEGRLMKTMISQPSTLFQQNINISGFRKGTYFVQVAGKKNVFNTRFVKTD